MNKNQPPSGGCVLKLCGRNRYVLHWGQPPSGGCVLKQTTCKIDHMGAYSAAFGRLCVETGYDEQPYNQHGISRLRAAVC